MVLACGTANIRKILSISNKKNLVAAINFQLRYAPFVVAARNMIDQGLIGELYDLEIKVCTASNVFPGQSCR